MTLHQYTRLPATRAYSITEVPFTHPDVSCSMAARHCIYVNALLLLPLLPLWSAHATALCTYHFPGSLIQDPGSTDPDMYVLLH